MKKTLTMVFAIMCLIFVSDNVQAQNFNELFGLLANSGDDPRPPSGGQEGGSGLGGGSGGGEEIVGILLNWPARGKMINQSSELSWKSAGTGAHTVVIAEETLMGDADPIFVAATNGNHFYIPLDHLNLQNGKEYYVRVKSSDGLKSSKSIFSLADRSVYTKAMEAAKSDERYNKGTKLEKVLMKSWALEQSGLKKDAAKYYTKYMEAEKDNIALRNMRDQFRKRTNTSF